MARPLLRVVVLLTLALLLAACAAQLTPAPEAARVEGRGQGASAAAGGVRVVARARAWQALPTALETVVTPVLVTIENDSAVPVRLRYDDFALVSLDGRRFPARAPFEVEGFVSEPAWGYYAYPPYGRFGYPRYPVVVDPYWYDPFFDGYNVVTLPLPTPDMVQLALPERVVEPQGRSTGFVYFERVRKVSRVNFTLRLVDARSGEALATVTIPFVVD